MDDPASYYFAFLVGGSPFPTTLITVASKLLGVLFFVAANGFFVGAEFALVSVRRTRLEARAAAGSRRARAALRLTGNPTLFISATQLGIPIASLALGWIGEPTVVPRLQPIASGIAFASSQIRWCAKQWFHVRPLRRSRPIARWKISRTHLSKIVIRVCRCIAGRWMM